MNLTYLKIMVATKVLRNDAKDHEHLTEDLGILRCLKTLRTKKRSKVWEWLDWFFKSRR